MRAGQSWIGSELLVDLSEIAAHARAEIGEGAAGVDKSDEQNLPAVLPERNALAALVSKGKVRDFLAGGGHVQSICWRRREGRGAGCDFDVLEPVVDRLSVFVLVRLGLN